MLQWNHRRTALLVMALLVALAATGGWFGLDWSSMEWGSNITW
jgi:hypothetical protein